MKQVGLVGAFLLGALLPPLASAQGPTPSPDVELYAHARGDRAVELKWGVYEPATPGPWPAVIVIHAGAFKTGTRNDDGVVLCANDLAAAGYLAFSVSYRLAPPGHLPGQMESGDDGRYPEQYEDISSAIQAARSDSRCNGWVGAVGGSSGASHAAYQAFTGTPGADQPDAVVCLSGDFDFTNDSGDTTGRIEKAVTNYVGTTDMGELLQASPINYVMKTIPPMFLFNSTKEFMPLPQLQEMVDRLTTLGVKNFQSQILKGNLHAFDYWSQVKDQSIAFLNNSLEQSGRARAGQ